jgi:hypothetical protein
MSSRLFVESAAAFLGPVINHIDDRGSKRIFLNRTFGLTWASTLCEARNSHG